MDSVPPSVCGLDAVELWPIDENREQGWRERDSSVWRGRTKSTGLQLFAPEVGKAALWGRVSASGRWGAPKMPSPASERKDAELSPARQLPFSARPAPTVPGQLPTDNLDATRVGRYVLGTLIRPLFLLTSEIAHDQGSIVPPTLRPRRP